MIEKNSVQLILGGARSGKSSFAEKLAESLGNNVLYVATGQAFDDEMADRIARHQADRVGAWATLEEPLELAAALQGAMVEDRIILLDCLTLWLSNLMLAERDIEQAVQALIEVLAAPKGHIILVSNEVGQSIVPDNALARRFRDEAGWLNQEIAVNADKVAFITAGLPQWLK